MRKRLRVPLRGVPRSAGEAPLAAEGAEPAAKAAAVASERRAEQRQPVAELLRVSKTFGDVRAVRDVSFAVQRGEFFSILGPSGCGKTTTLRLLAGFEDPDDDGEVRLLGERVNQKRPYERPISMVFQNYALFPHLSVERNIAFGLERRKLPRPAIAERVRRALETVRLDPASFARRMPAQLSGGQRQRVALARALVLEPTLLLLDEPLGAIDLKLRKQMQLELKALNKQLGITFIYVTHDQEEALTMSDRIAVMDQARLAQIGTPAEIYEHPRTEFVARFIGEANFLGGRAARRSDGWWELVTPEGVRQRVPSHTALEEGGAARIAVRPEWLELREAGRAPAAANHLGGVVREVVYLGERMHVIVALPDGSDWTVAVPNERKWMKPALWKPGEAVLLCWQPEDCQILEHG
jgi:spermidine/putrescine transport system ATP-binding protein